MECHKKSESATAKATAKGSIERLFPMLRRRRHGDDPDRDGNVGPGSGMESDLAVLDVVGADVDQDQYAGNGTENDVTKWLIDRLRALCGSPGNRDKQQQPEDDIDDDDDDDDDESETEYQEKHEWMEVLSPMLSILQTNTRTRHLDHRVCQEFQCNYRSLLSDILHALAHTSTVEGEGESEGSEEDDDTNDDAQSIDIDMESHCSSSDCDDNVRSLGEEEEQGDEPGGATTSTSTSNNLSFTHVDVVAFLALFRSDFQTDPQGRGNSTDRHESDAKNAHARHNGKDPIKLKQQSNTSRSATGTTSTTASNHPVGTNTISNVISLPSILDQLEHDGLVQFQSQTQLQETVEPPYGGEKTKTSQSSSFMTLRQRLLPRIISILEFIQHYNHNHDQEEEEMQTSTFTFTSSSTSSIPSCVETANTATATILTSAAMNLALHFLTHPMRSQHPLSGIMDDTQFSTRSMSQLHYSTDQALVEYILRLYPLLSNSQQWTFIQNLLVLSDEDHTTMNVTECASSSSSPSSSRVAFSYDPRYEMVHSIRRKLPPRLQPNWMKLNDMSMPDAEALLGAGASATGLPNSNVLRRRLDQHAQVCRSCIEVLIALIRKWNVTVGFEAVSIRLEKFAHDPWYNHHHHVDGYGNYNGNVGDNYECGDDKYGEDSDDSEGGEWEDKGKDEDWKNGKARNRRGTVGIEDVGGTMWRDKDWECTMVELYCVALVEYLQAGPNLCDDLSSNDGKEMKWDKGGAGVPVMCMTPVYDGMDMIQRLLFSYWDLDPVRRGCMKRRNGGVVLGLILAKYWIHSSLVNDEDRDLILEWVGRLLKGDNYVENDCEGDDDEAMIGLDAVTGYWLVDFLSSLCPGPDLEAPFLTSSNVCLVRYQHILPIESVLDRVKMLTIVRLGLFSHNTTKKDLSDDRVLGYVEVPSYFCNNSRARKGQIFSIASMLERIYPGLDSVGLVEWFRFVNGMVDLHFQLARSIMRVKWKPDGWLVASVEMFGGSDIELSSNNHGFIMEGMEDDLKPLLDCSEVEDKPDGVLKQYARAYAIAIAVNQAVLKNSYHHFKKHGQILKKRDSIMKLIQFQLAKLYDLNHRYHQALIILDKKAESEIQGFTRFLSGMFFSPSFVPIDLIRDSISTLEGDLQRNAWDSIITDMITSSSSPSSDRIFARKMQDDMVPFEIALRNVQHAFELHSCALQHFRARLKEKVLICEIAGWGNQSFPVLQFSSSVLNEQMVKSMFQVTKTVILWIPLCNRFYTSDSYLGGTSVISDPFIVRNISDQIRSFASLSICTLQMGMDIGAVHTGSASIVHLIGGDAPAMEENKEADNAPLFTLVKLFLISGDALIMTQLFDLIKCLQDVQGACSTSDWLRKLSWQHLNMDYDFSSNLPPPHLMGCIVPGALLHSVTHLILKETKALSTKESVIQEPTETTILHLLEIAVRSVDGDDTERLFTHSLLNHWGLEMADSNIRGACEDFAVLTNGFRVVLSAIDRRQTSPRDRKRSKKEPGKLSLTKAMLLLDHVPMKYDILFHVIIATLSIYEAKLQNEKDKMHADFLAYIYASSQSKNEQQHEDFMLIIKCFDNILGLISTQSKKFTKGNVMITIKGCLNVICTCERLVMKTTQMVDLALKMEQEAESSTGTRITHSRRSAAKTLGNHVNGIKLHVRDRISAFCISALKDKSMSKEVRRALSSLEARGEKLASFLLSNESKNIFLPSTLMLLPGTTSNDWKMKPYQKKQHQKPPRSRKKHKNSVEEERVQSVHMSSSLDSDDNDSFGVTGDWGEC